jgi:hypothetical protein
MRPILGFDGERILRGSVVYEYRVTKYDPKFRDASGHYLREDWIMFQQIGESFSGAVLTAEEYERVETAYVNSAIAFLREAGLLSMSVADLENHRGSQLAFRKGSTLSLGDVAVVIRQMLQEKCWCRLEGKEAFVHIGWDYYMYIGVPRRCLIAEQEAAALGLFVEEFVSPYHTELDD